MAISKPEDQPEKRAETGREKFLAGLRRGMTVSAAARAAKIDKSHLYQVRLRDESFAAAWRDAEEEGTDVAEAEVWRRAVKGVPKPVFQGGAHVGEVREYSDGLLTTLLKARRPEKYRERSTVDVTIREFDGWSDEELEEYARSGKRSERGATPGNGPGGTGAPEA